MLDFESMLNRDFAPKAPAHAYFSDITYLWTQEGWLYLAWGLLICFSEWSWVGLCTDYALIDNSQPFVITLIP